MVFICAEICLDLKGDTDDKFRDLTICVATSLAPTGEVVQNTNQAAEQIGTSGVIDS
jgi:hypothetical protein